MDQATKKEKYGEKKNSSRNLIIKIAIVKLDEKTIQLFIADVLASQKNISFKQIIDLEALTYISFHQNWFITYKKLQKPQYIWLEDEHFILAVETS